MTGPMIPPSQPVVFIADDDPSIRLLVHEVLDPTGFQVEEASDGEQALAFLKVMQADLLLLDVTMPGINGFDLCATLRQMPQYAMTPVLMITGHDDLDSITRAFEVGATDFVTKPIHWELLPYRVRYLLRTSDQEKEHKQAQEEVMRLNRQTEFILNSAGDGICGLDRYGNISFLNNAASHITGWKPDDLLGQSIHPVLHHSHNDGTPYSLSDCPIHESLFDRTIHRSSDEIFWKKNGSSFPVEYVSTPIVIEEQVTGVVVVFRDITQRKQAEEALRNSQARLAHAQKIASLGNWQFDLHDHQLHASDELYRILGRTPQEVFTSHEDFSQAIHPEDRGNRTQSIEQALAEGTTFFLSYRVVHPSGENRIVHEQGEIVCNDSGKPIQIIGTIQDITERRRAEEQIHNLAYYDGLTNLPNRRMFQDLLEKSIALGQRTHKMGAVLLVNLDRFTRINDTLGHTVGDQLLQEVGKRLLSSVRRSDSIGRFHSDDTPTVSRFGGDEFTILLTYLQSAEDSAKVARRIIDRLRQPFNIDGQEIFITASIGITVFPADGSEGECLLKNAHIAMQHAKEDGRSTYQYYSPAMNEKALARLALENSLCKAIERGEFVLHYQPQVDIHRGNIKGVEALIRWHHPDLGLVSPTDFIPLAEESGLIKSIGEWALRTACLQHKVWREAGLPPIRIGVNLSGLQFRHEDLIGTIEKALAESGLHPQYLELELTEGVLMLDGEKTISTLKHLKGMGIGLAIDDFGSGYSSLSYLKRFAVDTVKIDQAFVKDLTTDPNDAAIIKAIIALAHSLNLRVLAEGVETDEQLSYLRDHGCDELQGYLFSPALDPENLVQFYHRHHLQGEEAPLAALSVSPVL